MVRRAESGGRRAPGAWSVQGQPIDVVHMLLRSTHAVGSRPSVGAAHPASLRDDRQGTTGNSNRPTRGPSRL